jgi:spore coat protein CotH
VSRRVAALVASALLGPLAWIAGAQQASPPVPTARAQAADAQAKVLAGVAKVFDTSVLHRLDLTIADQDANQLLRRTTERVRCTLTFDGTILRDVGVRQAGGVYHPYLPIASKPSLSLEFDEFAKGQTLFGLDRLVLKNELQDYSLVNEHLTYEIFRRAGVPAPLTAHARVTINGIDDGIYLLREPIGKDFLVRNFGANADRGNVYEIENVREFVFDPSYPTLKDEGKDGHVRGDLVRFAEAIRSTSGAAFEADLAPYLDIDRFVTYVAAEIATVHWDGLTYRNNNTYIYARRSDGRFVFIPYGADQALGGPSMRGGRGFGGPTSFLVGQLMSSPALSARLTTEVARIGREPVWNQELLLERLARVATVFATAEKTGRTGADVAQFERFRPSMESVIRAGGAAR